MESALFPTALRLWRSAVGRPFGPPLTVPPFGSLQRPVKPVSPGPSRQPHTPPYTGDPGIFSAPVPPPPPPRLSEEAPIAQEGLAPELRVTGAERPRCWMSCLMRRPDISGSHSLC
ncbi:hypothetical protein AAFF_G00299600 [Aldrovandia affinis]|uniref:Uncharacterized protein n=1 Tax=Aldrovandia affinis TaxID=143900 RepID=A0AAD7R921_9TELE|nr:hypothetical protein AAFF_G00299600 [Aldrovandia affinis]